MKSIELLKSMNDIDDKYILESAPEINREVHSSGKVRTFKKYYVPAGLVAAAFVVFLSFRAFRLSQTNMSTAPAADSAPASESMAESAEMSGDAPAAGSVKMDEGSYADESVETAGEEYAGESAEMAEEEYADESAETAETETAEEAAVGAADMAEETAPALADDHMDNDVRSFGGEIQSQTNEESRSEKEKVGNAKVQDEERWKESSLSEIENVIGKSFSVPNGSERVSYRLIRGSLAEMDLNLNGFEVTARMEKRTDFKDISGSNESGSFIQDISINGAVGELYQYGSEDKKSVLCLFSDNEIMYSLTVSGDEKPDIDNVIKLAEQIWK